MSLLRKYGFFASFLAALTFSFASLPLVAVAQSADPTATATQAYIYGFPMIDLYRIMFGYFIDSKSPAFTAPFNTIHNTANVYTPADTIVQTPNSDTPYSTVGLDLRAEPLVLTMPPIESTRYYSAQFVDQYTYNLAYVGSRTTGNGGGKFLIAGPSWNGAVPTGITKVIRYDTQFGLVLIRTQLIGPSDLDNVRKIQAGYSVQPLSAYSQTAAPPTSPAVNWPLPLSPADERTSPQFFNVLAFILQFCPTPPTEVALRQSFSGIGIIPGKTFDPGSQTALYVAGMTAGQNQIDAARATTKSANDLFGTSTQMDGNYLNRALGAQWGILGNSAAEAVYLSYEKTADGQALGGAHTYTIHFAKGGLPPTKAFWSLTMYDLPQQLLVANSIDRYLINSPMLPNLKLDADGGLTLYIQNASPGADRQANWLPAPAGAFMMVLRDYWPEQSMIDGKWVQPPITVTK
jgi:hypothetical protein